MDEPKPRMTPGANVEYKNNIFCMLYEDRKNVLELYNAVNHSSHTDPDILEIVTLKNAIFMNIKNDLAFVIDTHLNLYEHQSTYNPNMPLRDLFYVTDEYRMLVETQSLYASTRVHIPAPKFVVFYNGTRKRPEVEEFKLSDLYETKENNPQLELKVTVLNINQGNNVELLNSCKILNEYMQYVNCVRKYVSISESVDEAVLQAVDECIHKGILREFLINNKAEAINMSIYEYNEAEEKEKMRRQEREGAYREGMEKGIEQGKKQGIEQGIKIGAVRGEYELKVTYIKRLKANGLTLEKIAELLGEDVEDITAIDES